MLWCGIVFVAITIGVALFKAEQPSRDIPNMTEAYAQMFQVLRFFGFFSRKGFVFSQKRLIIPNGWMCRCCAAPR